MNEINSPIAVILAAGAGRRLEGDGRPKALLSFAGKTLLERHLTGLSAAGVSRVSITVGYRGDLIRSEVARLGLSGRVSFVDNTRYAEGSLVSVWVQRHVLRSGAPILLMDADVLCDARMFSCLIGGRAENTLLFDREIEPGDEPVKICLAEDGSLVDFRKRPDRAYARHGESVGFFLFSPQMSATLADRVDAYVEQGLASVEYEEAIRDLILSFPSRFGIKDVTALPWTEIDFQPDVERAEKVILPQLADEICR